MNALGDKLIEMPFKPHSQEVIDFANNYGVDFSILN